MITMAIRYPFLFFFKVTGQLDSLFERAYSTVIGVTGHISMFDEEISMERKLKPLNRFEQWLLQPIIEVEQKRRRECFREAVIEVTGENIEDWS